MMDKTFLKWAGGKNWFIKNYSYRLPTHYNRYIDPFLGGGSLFFYLEPEEAILSDINNELITTYISIKENWKEMYKRLKEHNRKHCNEYYYAVRNMKPRTNSNIAARMIYLNRACFNGIYRVNSNGGFNVPIGTNNKILLDSDMFDLRADLLKKATIICQDFEHTIDMATMGDFLFCDPPYTIQDNSNGFIGYTKQLFNWNDQVRLAEALHRAKNRGVKIIMTNANHDSIRNLYKNIHGYTLEEITRYSSISGKSKGRQQYRELIISANII